MADDLEIVTALPPLEKRSATMHKGEAGRLFCLAGSVGMVGAAALASRAALRCGAGLVRVGMPWRLAAVVAGRDPNVMTSALPETEDGTISAMSPAKILKAAEASDVMLIGPGLSQHPQTVQAVINLLPQVKAKVVIDADGLNAVAHDKCEVLKNIPHDNGLPILTPHPGEMLRLLGKEYDGASLKAGDDHRRDVAVAFARKYGVVLVLKGFHTVVTDGARVYVNQTGNPGMAKAGVGDVLCGAIAAFRCQGYDSFEAATLGVYLHGLAGDLVCAKMGEIGMIATDIIEELPEAARRHQEQSESA
ncbi:MAG: NAD(P)H-hydrate dehydratase [Planctomycetes bacterium]|nr:NAD(P)H-hydrate dehydratase [Planctomycetota bacterium]